MTEPLPHLRNWATLLSTTVAWPTSGIVSTRGKTSATTDRLSDRPVEFVHSGATLSRDKLGSLFLLKPQTPSSYHKTETSLLSTFTVTSITIPKISIVILMKPNESQIFTCIL